jgi:histidinol-phosphatase (PHP family)
MRPVLVDYHMHLRKPSPEHGEVDHTAAAVERYAEVASKRGVDEIGISEHVYYFRETAAVWELPNQQERCIHPLDAYCDAVLEARRHGVKARLALEVDWVPARADELAEVLAPYPWDYLLGAVHWIDGLAIDSRPGWWDHAPPEDVWSRYVGELTAAASSGHFDVLAHPDLAKIFGHRLEWDRAELVRLLDGVALEVSTAGLHKPVGELYPDSSLLSLARDAGITITLASAAHRAEDVGRDLERAVEHARAAGYDTVTVFERRRARQEPLG